MWHEVGGADWWWMSLMMFLFWGALIGLVLWGIQGIVRSGRDDGEAGRARREPEEIAQERYARGEISRDEYIRITQDLKLGSGGAV